MTSTNFGVSEEKVKGLIEGKTVSSVTFGIGVSGGRAVTLRFVDGSVVQIESVTDSWDEGNPNLYYSIPEGGER